MAGPMVGQAPEIWVGTYPLIRPLTSLAWWGDLQVRHRWPLGSWECKWRMPLAPWQRYPQLRDGVRVDVRIGPWPYWTGQLAEIGWDDGEMVAVGAAREAEEALCLDGAGRTSSIPDTAMAAAFLRGAVTWTHRESFSGSPLGGSSIQTDRLNYVGALLDAWAESVSKRWWVDPWRKARADADPTVPAAYLVPDSGVLGVADEAKAGTVFGRYLDAATGQLVTAKYPAVGGGRPEVGMNLVEKHGAISAATATGICQGVWSKLQAKPGWVNGFTVRTGQLLTPGGVPMSLWSFTAGQMVRLLGVRDERGLSANTDVVIGESIWTPGEDTLQLNPVGMAARDIGSIIEDAGGVRL